MSNCNPNMFYNNLYVHLAKDLWKSLFELRCHVIYLFEYVSAFELAVWMSKLNGAHGRFDMKQLKFKSDNHQKLFLTKLYV